MIIKICGFFFIKLGQEFGITKVSRNKPYIKIYFSSLNGKMGYFVVKSHYLIILILKYLVEVC